MAVCPLCDGCTRHDRTVTLSLHHRRYAVVALIASGLLWGATVPLSKLALGWLDPAWLTLGRFSIAAAVLGFAARRRLRAACSPRVLLAGGAGFGASVALQNAGIARTSVAHASVLMGVVPVLVAVIALLIGHGHASRREWASFGLSALGIALIAGGGGGGSSLSGDGLVLLSVLLSAALIAVQPRLLQGRDPAALTAVQFIGAAGFALPLALAGGHLPHAPQHPGALVAFIALTGAGTVLPFWLFAYGQAKVRPQLAGAFVNLEPVVGAAIGWVFFGDPTGATSLLGAGAVIAALALAATVRPLPTGVGAFAVRAWRSGIDLHATMLAWPEPEEDPLRWRERETTLTLEGRFLPADPDTDPRLAPLSDLRC